MGLETGQFAQSCQVRGTQALPVGRDREVREQLVCCSVFSEIRSKWRLVRPCGVRGTHGACQQIQSCPETVSCGRSFQPLCSWSPFTLRVSHQSIVGVQHCIGVRCMGSDSATHTHTPLPTVGYYRTVSVAHCTAVGLCGLLLSVSFFSVLNY